MNIRNKKLDKVQNFQAWGVKGLLRGLSHLHPLGKIRGNHRGNYPPAGPLCKSRLYMVVHKLYAFE